MNGSNLQDMKENVLCNDRKLSTAIKLKQLDSNLNVCVLEKASEIGAHIISGNVFETRALDELLPQWKELNAPVKTKVTKEKFLFLGKNTCPI